MLPVGKADDAGESMGGAVLMDQVEALESEHSKAPAREVEERGAPHPAEAEHDHVIRTDGTSSLLSLSKRPQNSGGQLPAKVTFTIPPLPHTNQPALRLANPTDQQFAMPESTDQVLPSSGDQAAPPGPVATTVSLSCPGT